VVHNPAWLSNSRSGNPGEKPKGKDLKRNSIVPVRAVTIEYS